MAAPLSLRVPDYRGSEDVRNYVLPIPWFVYRGEIFVLDRDGARARLFDSDRVEVNLSVGGAVFPLTATAIAHVREWRI